MINYEFQLLVKLGYLLLQLLLLLLKHLNMVIIIKSLTKLMWLSILPIFGSFT